MKEGKIVLALAGPKGSGKSYVAEVLSNRFGVVPIALADKLKYFTDILFDWQSSDDAEDGLSKELPINHPLNTNNLSYRDIWIEFGAICNQIEDGVFIRHTMSDIKQLTANGESVIITDIRRQKEIEFCEEHNIPIVYIDSDSRFTSSIGTAFESPILTYTKYHSTFRNVKDGNKQKIINHFKELFQ